MLPEKKRQSIIALMNREVVPAMGYRTRGSGPVCGKVCRSARLCA